jgi:hypothetical protein
MSFSRRAGRWATAVAAAPAILTSAHAVDATSVLVYNLGRLHLRPHLALSERYDDNIFYRPDGSGIRDDFISVLSPGMNLQLGRKESNHLLFDYTLDQSFYAKNDEQSFRDHTFSLETRLEFGRLTVEGNDRVQFLAGILGGGSNLGQRVNRRSYSDQYHFEFGLSEKTGVYLGGNFDAVDFESGTPLYDYNTLQGTGGFIFKATPKTGFFGELYYGQAATDPNIPFNPLNSVSFKAPHAEFIGGYLGARGDFTPRLTGTIKAGYEVREFSDGTPAANSPVVDASMDYRFSEKTSATLSYSRRNSVSVQLFRQSYTADAVRAEVTQILSSNGKLVGILGGYFENGEYERIGNFARGDLAYRLNATLRYNIQLWLSTSLGYEHEAFRSNENQVVDYDVNRVTLRVAIGY